MGLARGSVPPSSFGDWCIDDAVLPKYRGARGIKADELAPKDKTIRRANSKAQAEEAERLENVAALEGELEEFAKGDAASADVSIIQGMCSTRGAALAAPAAALAFAGSAATSTTPGRPSRRTRRWCWPRCRSAARPLSGPTGA